MPAGSPTSSPPPDTETGTLPDVDLPSYGSRTPAVVPTGSGEVNATMVLDRLPRLLGGVPGYGYTVNGAVYPHIPGIEVGAGGRAAPDSCQ